MKIKQDHYNQLIEAFTVISPTVKSRYKKEGLSDARYIWDCFWYICDNNLFRPETLYSYMNDSHIETALRKILLVNLSNKLIESNLRRNK